MKLFLISPQHEYEDSVEEQIRTHFGDNYIALDNRQSSLWMLAAPSDKTPAGIAEMLNMKSGGETIPSHGLVVQVADYYGFDSKALWQQLDVWLNE